MSNSSGGSKRSAQAVIPLAEWLVAALGMCVVLATFGILAYSIARNERGSPELSVRVDSTVAGTSGTSLVMFTVLNEGGSTASDVQVEADVDSNGASEQRTLTFDFLPPNSERQGVLLVSGEAKAGGVRMRVSGYQK